MMVPILWDDRDMDEHTQINYKTLRRLQQDEQASSSLTKISGNFYKELSSYIKTLEQSIEHEKNPLKLKLFSDEVQNTKKIANSIYELREKKIVQAALATARGATPDVTHFLDIEKKLYQSLVEQIKDSRKEIFEHPSENPVTTPTSSPENSPVKQTSNTQPIVRVLEDTPAFIGTDGATYSLRKEDVLSLPREMTEPLLKKKVVARVK
jgi:DNA replication initiation complex subunit (GINS family)